MKKFLSIVLALLMLIPFSALSVLAIEITPMADEETASCTIGKENIASDAYVSYVGESFFALSEGLLTDGNKDVVAHSPKSTSFSWTLKFGKPYEITNVDLYVNGSGRCYKCGGSHEASAYNSVKSVQIILYDDLGAEVYKSETMPLLEYNGDGDVMAILEEAKFEFPKVSVASITIQGKTDSYGSAFFREVEVYKEIGSHNWVLDETSSTPSSCTSNGKNFYDCECGAEKQERTSKHTVEEWTVTQAPTTTETGMAEGPCIVPGCGGTGSKALPRLMLSDTEFPLTINNFTATEDVKTGSDMSTMEIPNEGRDVNKLFDGVIETATWQPGNFWCGTGFTKYDTVVDLDSQVIGKKVMTDITAPDGTLIATKDTSITQEILDKMLSVGMTELELSMGGIYTAKVDDRIIGTATGEDIKDADSNIVVPINTYINEDVLATIKATGATTIKVNPNTYSTLTIELDQVYTLTMAEMYVFSNNNTFTVDFLDANGNSVKLITKSGFEYTSGYARVVFTGEIYGLDVKTIVLSVKGAKWDGGVGLAFTEVVLGAHECTYTDEAIASGTADGCATIFNGVCTRCQANRTGARIVTHSFEKDENDPTADKVTVVTEATCFSNGIVTKHCTACNTDVRQMELATGNHVFDREKVVTEPNCGQTGISYDECSTPGCTAKSDEYVTPTKGNHNYKWVEKEDDKADYTHEGTKVYRCEVCEQVDESKGTQASPMLDAKIVSSQDWTIRYTDFVSARANFKINLSKIKALEEEGYTITVTGVVQKGEETKEIVIYGANKTGTYRANGSFALVVKDAGAGDEYKFSVVTLIEAEDESYAEVTTAGKAIAGNNDGTVCVYDVAKYYINNDSRASRLENNYGVEVKNFYASLVEQASK